ncbi:MAG TPA: hypothetical protein QGF58_01410 [Myxococcota bacterium]|nr:hypothetical protein [Myxococcota bacterium]
MRHLGALVVVAVAFLVVWPGPFADGALGHPTGDMPDHLWGTWWVARSLASGDLPLTTAITHLPEGGALWHPDPLGALIAAPFSFLGPHRAWNLLVTLQVVLAGVAAYGMGRDISGDPVGGVAAGIIVAASPYVLGLVHSGLSEYLGLLLPVCFLWTLVRSLDGRSPAWLPGLLLGLCAWQALYYGVFGGLLALCLVTRARLPTLARTLAVGALVAAPAAGLAWWSLHAPDPAFTPDQAPGWEMHRLPAVDLMSWLRPGDWFHPDTPALGNPGILHVNYVGWSVVALAVVALVRRPKLRRDLRGAAAFGVLALGPALSWNRMPLRLGTLPLLLPLALLYATPLDFIHHPYRIAGFVMPLLALFAAVGVSALPRVVGLLAPAVVLVEFLFASPGPWPVQVTPMPEVAELEGARLDWPPDASAANRQYLLAQTLHGQPIAYGINVFVTDGVAKTPLANEALGLLEVETRSRNRDVPGRFTLPEATGPSLDQQGFHWLVLHEDQLSGEELEATMRLFTRRLGPPDVASGDVAAWRLRDQSRP